MRTIEDLRLEMAVSEEILELVRDAIAGDLDDMPNGDLQGVCEALAAKIIKAVRETK